MTSALNQDKLKKMLQWLSEMVNTHPEKTRANLLQEAELRFDLTPKECLFLDRNFQDQRTAGEQG